MDRAKKKGAVAPTALFISWACAFYDPSQAEIQIRIRASELFNELLMNLAPIFHPLDRTHMSSGPTDPSSLFLLPLFAQSLHQ